MDRMFTGPRAFSNPPDRQPRSTNGNDGQPTRGNDRQRGQRDFGGVAEMPEPVFIDMALVRMCKDELDAVNLCIDLSRMSDEALCGKLGIDKGHFSRMRKGRAHFPTAKRLALMWLAGNWAPIQYEIDRTPILDRLKQQMSVARNDGFSAWQGAA